MEQEDDGSGQVEDLDQNENFEEMQEICSDMEDIPEDSDREEDDLGPLRDDASVTFSLHKGSVFSVSVNESGTLACSGGEDDQALVWKVADGSKVFQCQGHKDSVTCTGFSHDSRYVASTDMGGLVQVWAAATGKLVCSFETGDIEWLKWHPRAHVLLVGSSDGTGWMWKVPSGECKTFQGENARNVCGALTSDGKRVCCGYDNGAVKVLDLKEGVSLMSLTGSHAHTKAVTCLDTHHENMLLLTGSEDETAKLINSDSGKVLATFSAGFSSSRDIYGDTMSCGVEAVCFSTVLPVGLTGSLSGVLGVWDLPTQKLRHKCIHQEHPYGVVKVCSSQLAPVVYTGCLGGVVRGWDLRNGQMVREWQGHSDDILDLVLLKNESMILSASDDNTVRVFSIS